MNNQIKRILLILYLPIFCFPQEIPKKIKYIENKGQWNKNILYKANIPEGVVYLEKNQFTYSFYDAQKTKKHHKLLHEEGKSHEKDFQFDGFAFSVQFMNYNKGSLQYGSERLQEYHNYFIDKEKTKWKGKVPLYNIVNYSSIYNGIDLNVYSKNIFLKYDFIVSPNADPNEIKLYYNGVNPKLRDQNLEIDIGFNTIIEQKPIAYQIINGNRIKIECEFNLKDNIVSFIFPNGYDKNYILIIDPTLIAATLSGTVGADNYGHTATYGNDGEIFTGAISFGTGYPTNIGSFQSNHSGSTDIAISKLNHDGSALLWATYLGGGSSDYPHSMIVNSLNELYVYGSTNSTDYPTSSNAFQGNNQGNSDIIITHLSQDGSNIIGSTYIGGSGEDGRNWMSWNYGDTYRGEIMIDEMDNPFIVSVSSSNDFPVTAGVLQNNNAGGQDGVICKLNPDLSNLEWSTYLGSSSDDAAYGLRIDNNQNIYVTGSASSGFPTTIGSAMPNFIGGSHDAFICKISPQGNALLASSYFGSTDRDESFFLDIDINGNVYIYGQNFAPISITSGCYGVANSGIFIAKFNSDLTNIEWQTCIGDGNGSPNFVPIAFMVDVCKHIYISGHNVFGNLSTTSNAFYTTGGFYLMSLEPDASSVHFSTYYTNDHVDGGTSRFDPSGTVYQAVCSGGGFATTANAHSTSQANGWDIGVFKINFELLNFATASASPSDSGCAPFTVNFTNNSTATSYFWDFDDNGQTSIISQPTYTFNDTGTYHIVFIASDSTTCNISDTVNLQITVLPPLSTSSFDTTICDSYTWNGTVYDTSGTYSHSFASVTACDSIATLNLVVHNSNSGAKNVISCMNYTWPANNQEYIYSGDYSCILTNIHGCDSIANLNLTITNSVTDSIEIINCDSYYWDINDGHLYTNSGFYVDTVRNTDGCDTIIILNLIINNVPEGYDTVETCFEYTWPLNGKKYHQSGIYIDTINSSIDCDSIINLTLKIENIKFIIPNSFTPNDDDHNEIFYVYTSDSIKYIQDYKFRIFNRWGKNIFYSEDIEKGWDGKLNGRFVQNGVYVWEIQYNCKGEKIKRIGTVTLIN